MEIKYLNDDVINVIKSFIDLEKEEIKYLFEQLPDFNYHFEVIVDYKHLQKIKYCIENDKDLDFLFEVITGQPLLFLKWFYDKFEELEPLKIQSFLRNNFMIT